MNLLSYNQSKIYEIDFVGLANIGLQGVFNFNSHDFFIKDKFLRFKKELIS